MRPSPAHPDGPDGTDGTDGTDTRDRPPEAAGAVRVFAPPGPGRHATVTWARRHAERTRAGIELLVDPDTETTAPGTDAAAHTAPDTHTTTETTTAAHTATHTATATVASSLRGAAGWVLAALVGRPSLADRLGRASAGAQLLVVPQELPGVDRLVDTAYRPVTVVPGDPPHTAGPVVLALAPRTADEAVDAAFAAAAGRGAPLLALRLRDPERAVLETDDDAAEAVEVERCAWAEHLAAWRIAYPRVPLEVRVGEGDPALELVDLSSRARLLVLGRSARGRVLAAVTPSPVARVTRDAHCPVLVVPPPGLPRRPWCPQWRRWLRG